MQKVVQQFGLPFCKVVRVVKWCMGSATTAL